MNFAHPKRPAIPTLSKLEIRSALAQRTACSNKPRPSAPNAPAIYPTRPGSTMLIFMTTIMKPLA